MMLMGVQCKLSIPGLRCLGLWPLVRLDTPSVRTTAMTMTGAMGIITDTIIADAIRAFFLILMLERLAVLEA